MRSTNALTQATAASTSGSAPPYSRGVAATSLREVARDARGSAGHGGTPRRGREGLHEEVDDFFVVILREALVSVPLDGSATDVASTRDRAVGEMFAANPDVVEKRRGVVVTAARCFR